MTQTKVYKAIANTPFGVFQIAVLEASPLFAWQTMGSIVNCELKVQYGMFRIKELKKSNRRILKSMDAPKCAISNGEQFGWIKFIQK